MKLCRGYQIHDKKIAVFQSAKWYIHFRVMRIFWRHKLAKKCKDRACKEICTKINFVDAMNNKRIERNVFFMRFENSCIFLPTAMAIILILQSFLQYKIAMSSRIQKTSHDILWWLFFNVLNCIFISEGCGFVEVISYKLGKKCKGMTWIEICIKSDVEVAINNNEIERNVLL